MALFCHSEFNQALGKMQLLGVERVRAKGMASQRGHGTSSHGLELQHFWKAPPAMPYWQWASQSGGNHNADAVEGGCCVFPYIRVTFCALGLLTRIMYHSQHFFCGFFYLIGCILLEVWNLIFGITFSLVKIHENTFLKCTVPKTWCCNCVECQVCLRPLWTLIVMRKSLYNFSFA